MRRRDAKDPGRRPPPELLKGNYEQFLEKIVESSVDAIVAADRRGTIILFNAGAERISGYSAEEVTGRLNVEALYAPNVAREIMRRLRSPGFGGRGKLLDSVEALRTKDGREIPIHISAATLYEGGKELATVGIFTDLRDLLRLEKGIRESEELYRMMVEQAEEGIGIVQRGRLRFANRRLREILQIPPGESRNLQLSKFLDPVLMRTLGLLSSGKPGVVGGGPRVLEAAAEILGRQGARRSVEILAGPVPYRGAAAHQIHLRDVSAKRELENTYRVLVDTAARTRQGIILVREAFDEPGAVLFANEEFCRFTGWELEELRKLPLTQLFTPEGLRVATKVYQRLIRGEDLGAPARLVLRTRGGETIIVEASTARTTYQGRPALIGYCRDVTAHAHLEQLIDEQSRDLADKNKALEDILHRLRSTQERLIEQEKLAELGTFSAGIAHEIRNPLGLIRSHLRSLEVSSDERTRARALRGIERQVSRSSDFIDKILSYASPTAPVRRRLDLNRTLSMAARFAEKALSPPAAVRIHREFEEGLPAVAGDHTQLQEVFINLITNAFQAVGRWGTIRLVTGREGTDCLRVDICDTGPGIDEASLEDVFRPFYTFGKGREGTGMGLAIARRIVEGHQGKISAIRNPAGGTTFRVLLPLEVRESR
ncbi:MAG: PAS domain S-box protein [Deltaproteobacteria bacterium]|nr:PAS domain S-box protein [Deltaproteobacteria bacterium]